MGIFWEKKNKEDGKKSRFLHEIPNEGGRFSIEFVRKTGSETSEFLRTNGHF